jgi:hypothetical protein
MDYELPGNGIGDIKKLMIDPTERLLKILNRNNIKMTVFFEIEEYLNFKKHRIALTKTHGYDPVHMIESQVKRIVETNHEIGLHIHPQWIGAVFDGMQFKLNLKNSTLAAVYHHYSQLEDYLHDRITKLYTLANKFNSNCKITSFRAGGLSIRPEKFTLEILSSLGINADSSVVKGLHRKDKNINIDYRDAPSSYNYWQISNNVCQPDNGGRIIEFPIYSQMIPEYKKLRLNRIRRKFISQNQLFLPNPHSFSTLALPKNPLKIFRYIFRKSPLKFDYCHMSNKEMEKILLDLKHSSVQQSNYPLVAIGHSKEFFNEKNVGKFLNIAVRDYKAKFLTVAHAKNLFFRD